MNNAEIEQSVLDIKSWFSRTKSGKRFNGPASNADLQRLEKAIDTRLPVALKALLLEVNGGLYFLDKKQLSSDEIQDIFAAHERKSSWREGLIPFAGEESSLLVIDTRRNDAVREWDEDEGLGDTLSDNIVRYLEEYRNNLLGGHFEFLDDVGVVEKMVGKPRK
eukprot:CAMPEP_0173151250 /NCGR_PEP_ID=MMETSP1105-20130129/11458_1 /TAXON_ID=2985 /ORGANISM="Ochromonas sp., Strain BG-1" /LENGTH=163 /DNA_ID=CAMNT_0014066569 /DNA_START=3 /DNA_END=494 /DNA_ORIENTATION=+